METDREIELFWGEAQRQARLETVPAYFGPTALSSVPPPAWSFGDGAEADALLAIRSSSPLFALGEASGASGTHAGSTACATGSLITRHPRRAAARSWRRCAPRPRAR